MLCFRDKLGMSLRLAMQFMALPLSAFTLALQANWHQSWVNDAARRHSAAQGRVTCQKRNAVKGATWEGHWGGSQENFCQRRCVMLSASSRNALKTCRWLPEQVSTMAALRHPNVIMFMGLCLQPPCIITEFCARGSLFDVLRKARCSQAFAKQLDWSKRLSMALDAAKVCLIMLCLRVLSSWAVSNHPIMKPAAAQRPP